MARPEYAGRERYIKCAVEIPDLRTETSSKEFIAKQIIEKRLHKL